MGRYTQDTGGGDFKPAPAGAHVARCIKLIDLGTQHDEYQGKPLVRSRVLVFWELPNEMVEIEGEMKPAIVTKFYTNSLSEKANLRKDLEQWRGRPFSEDELKRFDLQSILNAPCMLSVIHNEKGRAQVGSIMKMPKGQTAPDAINKPIAFWLDEFKHEVFDSLSDNLKALIKKSPEYQEIVSPKAPASQPGAQAKGRFDDLEDDIPF
jgi:hypothetical protein